MPTFSANLGFLWNDRPLVDAIHAAANAGFDAVECHWPYDNDPNEVAAALGATGMKMLGLNTALGSAEQFGLLAVAGTDDAIDSVHQAVKYAVAIGAESIHAMAGITNGPDAHKRYVSNLDVACTMAADHGITVLIEPLNAFDNPGYFLANTAQAAAVIAEVDRPNLRLMFDCYHVARTEGDVTKVAASLRSLLPVIGHIQFASVPGRNEPDLGDLDYVELFALIDELGWTQPLGAEYRPVGTVEAGLGWMRR